MEQNKCVPPSLKLSVLAGGERVRDVAGRGAGAELCVGRRGPAWEQIVQLLSEDTKGGGISLGFYHLMGS